MGTAESTPIADPETLGTDGMLPSPGVLSHQILFDQHQYDFNMNQDALLSTDCAIGRKPDPLNPNITDEYLAVGLRTKFDGKGVKKYGRPPINLTLVIDTSGSMKAHFKSAKNGDLRSKLDIVKQMVLGAGGLLEILNPNDKVAIITFNTETKILQELVPVSKLVKDRVNTMLENQKPIGNTNLSQAVETAVKLMRGSASERRHPLLGLSPLPRPPPLVDTGSIAATHAPIAATATTTPEDTDAPKRLRRADTMYCQNLVDLPESRLMIITDEYLSQDEDHERALNTILRHADESQLHTTFVAMGVNYSPFISKRLSLVAGCNVISVHSAEMFREKVITEFDHICSPIAYNVTVSVETDLPEIVETFGTAMGREVIKMKSVFAGAGDETSVHGSVGLLRLKSKIDSSKVKCTTSFIDRVGTYHSETIELDMTDRSACKAFRKVVVLSRLGTLLKVFLTDETSDEGDKPMITMESGIVPLPKDLRTEWEGGLQPLLPQVDIGAPTYSASEGEEDGEGEGAELLGQDKSQKAWTSTPVQRVGSAKRLSCSQQSAPKAVPQSRVSSHYKTVLKAFCLYLAEECKVLQDKTLGHWFDFLDAIVHYIPEQEVIQAAEGHLTARVIYTGIDPDKVFDVLNCDKYSGKLRENHRSAVNGVFNKKMQAAILGIVMKLVDTKPSWVVATEEVKKASRDEVRGCFMHLEREEAWVMWRERWEPLVNATLRNVLHSRVFNITKRLYGTLKPEELEQCQLMDHVILELSSLCPELTIEDANHTDHVQDLRSFLSRWIIPALEKHNTDCRWCPEQGIPISNSEQDAPELTAAQCPTQ